MMLVYFKKSSSTLHITPVKQEDDKDLIELYTEVVINPDLPFDYNIAISRCKAFCSGLILGQQLNQKILSPIELFTP